jgi:N-acetylmuramoyl-L-alanine amidase
MSPWCQGKLTDRRFLIDPEGGPPAKTGAGLLGLSGSFVNLQIAGYLAGYLRGAGANVLISRSSEETRTPQDIVIMANRFQADRYIALRQRPSSDQAGAPADSHQVIFNTYYFPGSRLGSDYAEKLSFSMSGLLGLPLNLPGETITYPLQQTACPAVIVEGASLDRLETELLLGQSWFQRLIAYGIFTGTLSHFELSDRASIRVTIEDPEDPANWLVIVDDTWTLLTDPDGSATFHTLPAGPHTVEIQRAERRYLKQVEAVSDMITGLNFNVSDK